MELITQVLVFESGHVIGGDIQEIFIKMSLFSLLKHSLKIYFSTKGPLCHLI